jgi:hypothetical protein
MVVFYFSQGFIELEHAQASEFDFTRSAEYQRFLEYFLSSNHNLKDEISGWKSATLLVKAILVFFNDSSDCQRAEKGLRWLEVVLETTCELNYMFEDYLRRFLKKGDQAPCSFDSNNREERIFLILKMICSTSKKISEISEILKETDDSAYEEFVCEFLLDESKNASNYAFDMNRAVCFLHSSFTFPDSGYHHLFALMAFQATAKLLEESSFDLYNLEGLLNDFEQYFKDSSSKSKL